ncbi:MAG TPA: hemolysin family protein [Terriglobales bacterium]|nr:hemolysin family protein [Terriglobales bacterium]
MGVLPWAGFVLSFLAAFVFSVFHVCLGSISKISLSRLLEDREKEYRAEVLRDFDGTRLAVEYLRTLLVIVSAVYLFLLVPKARLWPLWSVLIVLAAYTVLLEALPRLLNSLGKEAVLRIFLPALPLARTLAAPVLALSHRLAGREEQRDEREEGHEASDEEIETFIDEATEEGIIDKGEDELLRSVVEFGDTVVREIMTSRVNMVCIRKDATIDNLKDLIIREKYSRIPVYKDRLDNVEGVVMAKDLLEYADEKHKAQPIEALVRPVAFVPESMPVPDLLKAFQRSKQKLAVVVDEHGGVSGLVTMEDVVEEIVGEIQDEYDTEEAQVVENGPLDYTVSGAAEVEELEELFDVELAEDDFITVGGLIAHTLGRLPQKGEKLTVKGLEVEVLDVDQKRIKKLRIRKA